MNIIRIENGKIAESWGVIDVLSLLQQLGVVPAPGGEPSTV
jgi:predicted ester cyclase